MDVAQDAISQAVAPAGPCLTLDRASGDAVGSPLVRFFDPTTLLPYRLAKEPPMPRKNSYDDIRPVTDARLLLKPPDDLDEIERREFAAIVLSAPRDGLTASDIPLIACYARAIVQERVAAGELKAAGHVSADGKPSPWLPVWIASQRAVTTLSRMLNLNPAGRRQLPAERQREQAEAVTSYYSRMALEAKRDETN